MRVVTEKQAAEFLCYSPFTLRNWRLAGVGPPHKNINGQIRYTDTDLIEWLEKHAQKPDKVGE